MPRRWRFTPYRYPWRRYHYPSRRLEDHVPTMRCPNCGKAMVQPTGEEVVHCPNCGAGVTQAPGWEGKLLGKTITIDQEEYHEPTHEAGEVALPEDEAKEKWTREHPDYYSRSRREESAESSRVRKRLEITHEGTSLRRGWISGTRCKSCHGIIMNPNANFCPGCGENLGRGAKGVARMETGTEAEEHIEVINGEEDEKCMVCNQDFGEGDIALRCPSCNRLAHRAHLLEWLHVKGTCPACEVELDERDL